jgi:hypothetical protein
MKKTRIAAFLLAALTLIPAVMTSCGGDDTTTTDTKADGTASVTEAVTEPVDALEARKLVDDEVETKDFGGAPFRIVTCNGHTGLYWLEAETGDVVDDAIFRRNSKVQERFNINMEVIFDDTYAETSKYLTNLISAGDDAVELIAMHVVEGGRIAINDMFLNWNDVPEIDFTKPWWSQSTTRDLSYDGVTLLAIGDFVLSATSGTYCTFYNKTLAENYDLPNMYDVVDEGKWTFDYIVSVAKDIYSDLNTNGEVDAEDLYGYTSCSRSAMDAFLWAFDNPVFRREDDKLVFSYKTAKINDIVAKLVNTFSSYEGIHTDFTGWNYGISSFAAGRAVFATGHIGASTGAIAELEDDMGFLPYPKWDEAQEEYYTMVDGSHQALAVPTTASKLDMIGAVTEVLNAESWKLVTPAYYDVALKVKATRDMESVTMLDNIVNSRIFDFGYVYDGWEGPCFLLEKLVQQGNTNFESEYAKMEKKVTKRYETVLEYFENYSN